MSVHSHHDVLSGFDHSQILHDGCDECEWRGEDPHRAISHLDERNFERAWKRAADWQLHGCPTISRAEADLLLALWAVQIQLEKRGVPIGELPQRERAAS